MEKDRMKLYLIGIEHNIPFFFTYIGGKDLWKALQDIRVIENEMKTLIFPQVNTLKKPKEAQKIAFYSINVWYFADAVDRGDIFEEYENYDQFFPILDDFRRNEDDYKNEKMLFIMQTGKF